MDLPWVRDTWLSSVMHNLYLWMRKSSRGHLAQLVPSVLISSPPVFLNAGWGITVWMENNCRHPEQCCKERMESEEDEVVIHRELLHGRTVVPEVNLFSS